MSAYLTRDGDWLVLSVPYESQKLARGITAGAWDPERRKWIYKKPNATIFAQIKNGIPNLTIHEDVSAFIGALTLKAEANRNMTELTWEGTQPLYPMPLKANIKPFDHQVVAYNLGISNNAAAFLMEQGTGKTLAAIATAGFRVLRGQVKKILVTCPTSVVSVWPKELDTFADFHYEARALVGPVKKKCQMLEGFSVPGGAAIAIVNYESAWRMEAEIKAWAPDMVIADESQRIKTPGARQSKGMHNIGKLAKYKLILTGTPVSNGPLEFWSQYKFLDPTIFAPSFFAFRNRYAVMGGFQRHQIVAYQNLPELTQKAHSIAFRVTKAEALDLPETINQNLYCTLEPAAASVYNQLLRESVAELSADVSITAVNVLARLLRLSQVAGGFYRDEEEVLHTVSTAKMDLFKETLDDLLGAGKKIVVFARFIPEIDGIVNYLKKSNIKYSLIKGSVPTAERGDQVDQFQNDPEVRVFVAQIQTAGLGITLHAADTAIFYSLDYSFANYDQCRARILRIGQRNTCTYIHLLAEKTVDETVMEALATKKNVADAVVDRWRELM